MRKAFPCHDALMPTIMAKMVLHWYLFDTRTYVTILGCNIFIKTHTCYKWISIQRRKNIQMCSQTPRQEVMEYLQWMLQTLPGWNLITLYVYNTSCILGWFSWHHFLTTLPLYDSVSPLFTDAAHYWLRLTHWSWDKMATVFQTTFWKWFFKWKCMNFA